MRVKKKALTKKDKGQRKRKLEYLRSLVRERIQERRKEPEMIEPDPPPGMTMFSLKGWRPLIWRPALLRFSRWGLFLPAQGDVF